MERFLQNRQQPHWISTNIKEPAFLTITTYQSLHSVYKTSESEGETDAEIVDVPINEIDEDQVEETNRHIHDRRKDSNKSVL